MPKIGRTTTVLQKVPLKSKSRFWHERHKKTSSARMQVYVPYEICQLILQVEKLYIRIYKFLALFQTPFRRKSTLSIIHDRKGCNCALNLVPGTHMAKGAHANFICGSWPLWYNCTLVLTKSKKPCDIPFLKRKLGIPQTGICCIWWWRIAACRDDKRQSAKALWIALGKPELHWWTMKKFKLGLQGDRAGFHWFQVASNHHRSLTPFRQQDVYASNDSGRYRIYGYPETIHKCTCVRGSMSWVVVRPWFLCRLLGSDTLLQPAKWHSKWKHY